MRFNKHSNLEGQHSFLSASQYQWIRYDEEKLKIRYKTIMAAAEGTRLHELASELIELGISLPLENKTLNLYVNDAIKYDMKTEVVLFYSYNAFCTVDAIVYDEVDRYLRIHDLKNGSSRASMDQLKIYAAYFCIEYSINPNDIMIELRIYQNDEIVSMIALAEDILYIMAKIRGFNILIETIKIGG